MVENKDVSICLSCKYYNELDSGFADPYANPPILIKGDQTAFCYKGWKIKFGEITYRCDDWKKRGIVIYD